MFFILLNPHPRALARPFIPKMLRTKECAPTPYSSVVFTSNSHLSLLMSLGANHIMWSMWLVRQLWLVMCIIQLIAKWWPLWFVTCNLRTWKLISNVEKTQWHKIITTFQNLISRDSWLIAHKLIGMPSKLFMDQGTPLWGWLIMSAHVYSIGFNHLISTPNKWSNSNFKINTSFLTTNTRAQNPLGRLIVCMF
jgi:hypothetical protein